MYPPVDGHSGYLHLLAIVNSTAVNIRVQVFVAVLFLSYMEYVTLAPLFPHCIACQTLPMLCVTLSLKDTRQVGVSYQLLERISGVVVCIAHEVAPILRKRPVSQLLQAARKAPVSFIQPEVEAFPLGHSARLRADSSFTPNTPVTDPHPNTQRD